MYNIKLQKLYENIISNKSLLKIGKFTLVDGFPIDAYDFNTHKNDNKILSSATRKNMTYLAKCGDVVFDKIYRADKSKGRGAISTYISGTLNGKDFVWARVETRSSAAGQTLMYYDGKKYMGTTFLENESKVVTREEGLYKVTKEYPTRAVIWYKNPGLTIRHRVNGSAYTLYDSEGNLVTEQWRQNNKFHRLDGPAIIKTGITKYSSGTGVGYYVDDICLFSINTAHGFQRGIEFIKY